MHLLNTGQNKDAEYLITENDFNCKKTPFEEISLQELNKCLQKFFFCRQEKSTAAAVRSLCGKIVIVDNSK